MEPKHRDLVTRCRAAQDEFDRLVRETDERGHEVRKWDNATQNGSWMLQQLNMTRPPRYPTEKEIADRNATISEARLAHDKARQKSRDIWTRYDSLRVKRGEAHEAFTKLVDEERNCAGLLAGKQRELGKLRPAPVMEPPPHLCHWSNVSARNKPNWSDEMRGFVLCLVTAFRRCRRILTRGTATRIALGCFPFLPRGCRTPGRRGFREWPLRFLPHGTKGVRQATDRV
jgi:hypothetical protein